MRDGPVFSFVIATYGRSDQIRRCLSSIAVEKECDFEVIVVDQNADDRVEQVVLDFSGTFPLSHLRQAVPGGSAARNFGAVHAIGKWIGFPDDDCCFLPDTFKTLRSLIRQHGVDLFTGMTVDEEGRPSVLRWQEKEGTINERCIYSTFAESTLYLRREIFWSVGGFDTLFGPGSPFLAAEGKDLVYRLWRRTGSKVRMRFYPTLRFFHADPRTHWDAERVKKARNYGVGRGACVARHWQSISSLQRALVDVPKHLLGSLVLRGDRRRSHYMTLFGYVEGFLKYHSTKRCEVLRDRCG